MRLYRVSLRDEQSVHCGFQWHRTRKDAEAAARAWRGQVRTFAAQEGRPMDPEELQDAAEVEVVAFDLTKASLLRTMQRVAAHADNG